MITKQTILDAIEEINGSLQQLAANGCRGFECSPQSLETLTGWTKPARLSSETLVDIRTAKLVFVGEGPGFDEDQKGEPFVGAAGQLLTKIVAAINLSREQVYICNIIKCRPPGNRNPESDEIESCLPFLERQIAAIQPDFICALGKFAAQTLLKSDVPISRLRGRFYDHNGIKVLPTYHPAYLLRNPEKKREVWQDMQMLMKEYRYED
jgi:DNA polymerase